MPRLTVKESVDIDATPEKVYQTVSNFSHWTAWSPWLIMEPDVEVQVGTDGKTYAWEGNRVGSGNMSVIAESADEWVDYDLHFLKPMKSHARVRFEISPAKEGCTATWTMDSSMPFFLFFLVKMTNAMIASDYRRGLAMLKDYVERGDVPSKLEFVGEEPHPGGAYVGVKVAHSISNISQEMDKAMGSLFSAIEANAIEPSGPPFVIYHKFALVKDQMIATSAVPVAAVPTDLPPPLVSGNYEACKVYTVRHTGPYRHIGNAWATIQNLIQNKAFKPSRALHPFELYVNDPRETAADDLITDIKFPMR